MGFSNVLDAAKRNECEHFVYASSSSVYGGNEKLPFSANDPVDHPVSLYAATKRANELVAHSYSHLFGLPTTGLRFFTVYGPWGRPDMALFKFTRAVLANEPVDVYADGVLERDFTYVDDIAEAVVRLAYVEPKSNPDWKRQTPTPCSSWAPFRTLNVGNQTPVPVNRLLQLVEQATGKSARRNSMPIQPGDVPATAADIGMLKELIDFSPATSLDVGVSRFVAWYREYFGI